MCFNTTERRQFCSADKRADRDEKRKILLKIIPESELDHMDCIQKAYRREY